jgi:hypothetical protein
MMPKTLEFGSSEQGTTDKGNTLGKSDKTKGLKLGGVGIRRLLGGGGRIRSARRRRSEEHGDGDERVRPVLVRKEQKPKRTENENEFE